MTNPYKIGDQVQLKSGGPVMTVSSVDEVNHQVHCQWFSGKQLEGGKFPMATLAAPKQDDGTKDKS